MSKAKFNIKILFIVLIVFIFLTLIITTNLLNNDKASGVKSTTSVKKDSVAPQLNEPEESMEEVEFEEKFKGSLIQ